MILASPDTGQKVEARWRVDALLFNPADGDVGRLSNEDLHHELVRSTACAFADSTPDTVIDNDEIARSGERYDGAANRKRLGGCCLLNLYTSWQFTPNWPLLVRLDNAADKRYQLALRYGIR